VTAVNDTFEVRAPDSAAAAIARDRCDEAAGLHGSLGRLHTLAVWGAGVQRRCPPEPFRTPTLLLLIRQASTEAPQQATDMGNGIGMVAELARVHGVTVRSIRIPEEAMAAFDAGRAAADDAVDSGADLLIPVLVDAQARTPAAALIGLFTRCDASAVTEFRPGGDDAEWMSRCAQVRDAMRDGRGSMGDPLAVISSIDAGPIAAPSGVLLQAAVRATPAIIDGPVACASALVAHRMARSASAWWVAASTDGDRALMRGLEHLEIPVIADLGIVEGTGVGALTVLPILQAAMASLRSEA